MIPDDGGVSPDKSNIVNYKSNGMPSEHEMMVYHTMAENAVSSKMYKGIGDRAGIMMIMLSARELGIPAMQALNGGLNIINGKVEISARMMSALIRKAGHKVEVKESSETHCVLVGRRFDTGEVQSASFTVAEAQKAGLVKQGGGWTKWPKDMCFARALSRLARQLFSDVIGIGYVEGEIRANENDSAPQQLIPDEEIVPELTPLREDEAMEGYLNFFEKEDKPFALEYLKVVQKHFGWTVLETIQELAKDKKKLFDKFNNWKNKITKSESK